MPGQVGVFVTARWAACIRLHPHRTHDAKKWKAFHQSAITSESYRHVLNLIAWACGCYMHPERTLEAISVFADSDTMVAEDVDGAYIVSCRQAGLCSIDVWNLAQGCQA